MGEWIKMQGFDGARSVLVDGGVPVRASWREASDPQSATAFDDAGIREAIDRRFSAWIGLGAWSQTDGGDASTSESVSEITLLDPQPTHRIDVRANATDALDVYLVYFYSETDGDGGAAYTRDEWEMDRRADWEVSRGTWLCQGQATPGGRNATVTVTRLCCYVGCARRATEMDGDGDWVCGAHFYRAASYVVTTHLDRVGSWLSTAQAERVAALMAAEGWDVAIREPRDGEAEATYRVQDDGTLQILGFGVPHPESLDEALRTATDRARAEVNA